ncbi:MAG: HAD family phosphatase [Gammaproteobacteria bacterium]
MRISAILFDLGGVLVELNHNADNVPWFDNDRSASENWQRWLTSPVSQQFERGLISPQEFAERFIKDNKVPLEPDSFLKHFESWVIGFYPGTFSLLQQLSALYPIGVFSNSNEVHWPRLYTQMQYHGSISYYFTSYLMGVAKPDPASFNHVATSMGIAPEEILFLDDNPINVESAWRSGFLAEQVSSFEQIPALLKTFGINLENQ